MNGVHFREPLLEAPFRRELKPEAWFYDRKGDRVYVHFGRRPPADCEVELTTRRRLFAPHKRGLGHIVVEGFVFEHCGNQYPTNFWSEPAYAQRGAVGTEEGHNWTIRRNVIRYAKTFALDVGRVDAHANRKSAYDNLIEENYLIDNGSAGVMSCGSRNLVIRGNVVLRNNRLRFLGKKRWEQAGIKCHLFVNGLIEGNYIAHNKDTYGVWLDNQFPDARVSSNVIHDNGRAGVFLEMSDYDYDRLLVDNNLIFDNDENAVYIHDASGATFRHNLLANTHNSPTHGQAIYIRQVMARTKTYHHTFSGNLLIGNARNVEVNYPAVRSGPQRFDHNYYDIAPGSRSFVVSNKSDVPSPWTAQELSKAVASDLGRETQLDEGSHRTGLVGLTLAEWRAFWNHHGEKNDRHSLASLGNSVTYDSDTHKLTIQLSAEPPIASGPPADSPLANLEQGRTTWKIWEGLPIVKPGKLPSPDWTSSPAQGL